MRYEIMRIIKFEQCFLPVITVPFTVLRPT
jgi:hypothetical protein